jgi:hypothetical protein
MNRMRDYSMKIFFYHGFAWMGADRAGCSTYAESTEADSKRSAAIKPSEKKRRIHDLGNAHDPP